MPARLVRRARRLVLHLPVHWPWADAWTAPFTATHAPPATACLVRVAGAEARLRPRALQLTGPDLDDLVHRASADALVAILGRLDSFRGESRFTTWAYRFVAFDLANKVEGNVRQRATVALSDQQWAAMPAQHSEPEYEVEAHYPSAW